jgi:hypothetical protein
MSSTVVLQVASGRHIELLDISHDLHNRYCARHNYEFLSTRGRIPSPYPQARKPNWDKVVAILDAIRSGYTNIIWLDADTLVTGDAPAVSAVRPGKIGMCPCHNTGWYGMFNGWHYNSGAMYIGVDAGSKSLIEHFFQEVFDHGPGQHPNGHEWQDQAGILDLCQQEPYTNLITPVDYRWNSIPGITDSPAPVVRAWHGHPFDHIVMEMKRYVSAADRVAPLL